MDMYTAQEILEALICMFRKYDITYIISESSIYPGVKTIAATKGDKKRIIEFDQLRCLSYEGSTATLNFIDGVVKDLLYEGEKL